MEKLEAPLADHHGNELCLPQTRYFLDPTEPLEAHLEASLEEAKPLLILGLPAVSLEPFDSSLGAGAGDSIGARVAYFVFLGWEAAPAT